MKDSFITGMALEKHKLTELQMTKSGKAGVNHSFANLFTLKSLSFFYTHESEIVQDTS